VEPEAIFLQRMSTLKRWIKDLGARSFQRQTEAMRSLTVLGSEAVPHLRRALEQHGPIARLAAIQVLERIGEAGATPLLVNCLSDEDPLLREAALIALGEIGTPEAAPFLCRSVLYRQPESEEALYRTLVRHYPQGDARRRSVCPERGAWRKRLGDPLGPGATLSEADDLPSPVVSTARSPGSFPGRRIRLASDPLHAIHRVSSTTPAAGNPSPQVLPQPA
jgi:hypothetical protein